MFKIAKRIATICTKSQINLTTLCTLWNFWYQPTMSSVYSWCVRNLKLISCWVQDWVLKGGPRHLCHFVYNIKRIWIISIFDGSTLIKIYYCAILMFNFDSIDLWLGLFIVTVWVFQLNFFRRGWQAKCNSVKWNRPDRLYPTFYQRLCQKLTL